MITDWCPMDLNAEVIPPSILIPRSPANLVATLEQFQGLDRYARRDVTGDGIDETFCNFFVRETLKAQGVDVPRGRANDLVDWLAQSSEWEECKPWLARVGANAGHPIVIGWKNPTGKTGHVARLRPVRHGDDVEGWYIAQAGVTNFVYGTLGQGFGARPVRFFAHP